MSTGSRPRVGDGFDFHRRVLASCLHELGPWPAREAKADELVAKMTKAGLLAPRTDRESRRKAA